MEKKTIKKILIAAGGLLGLFFVINLGINLWLKYQLPDYLRKQTDYAFNYKNLDIALFSGNITAKTLSIVPKNPDKNDILQVKGTVDLAQVSRFGLFKALFHKEIAFNRLLLENPNFTLVLPKTKNKKGSKTLPDCDAVIIKNGQFRVFNANQQALFSVQNFNLDLEGLVLENTQKNALPFNFNQLELSAKNLFFFDGKAHEIRAKEILSQNQKIIAQNIDILSKNGVNQSGIKGNIGNLVLEKLSVEANKISLPFIQISGADLEISSVKKKLSNNNKNGGTTDIKIGNFLVKQSQLTVKQNNPDTQLKLEIPNLAAKNIEVNAEKKTQTIENISLNGALLNFEKNHHPLLVKNIQGSVYGFEINQEISKKDLPFKTETLNLTLSGIDYKTEFYKISTASVSFDKKQLEINHFAMLPLVSRAEFIKKIPTERDLYDLKAAKIKMTGALNFLDPNQSVDAENLTIDGANANIFRSKVPKDDPTIKPLYSSLLKTIKFPLYIKTTAVRNGFLEYEEDTKQSEGPGKLTFSNFNLTAKNLNSGKFKNKPTLIPIAIDCRFFEASPLHVDWTFDTAKSDDAFTIKGQISSLPAPRINQFAQPYLKIKTEGSIEQLNFDFNGNRKGIGGIFRMKHKDLKVFVLKESGEKNKLLSAIANIFVKTNSDKFPDRVLVSNVERDPTKSFFNLFWKGIQQGLTTTLLGDLGGGKTIKPGEATPKK